MGRNVHLNSGVGCVWAQRRCETLDGAQLASGLTEESEILKLTFLLFGQQGEPTAFSRRGGEVQGRHRRKNSHLDQGSLEWTAGLRKQRAHSRG